MRDDPFLGERLVGQLGEDVLASRDANQLADPLDAADARIVPFFEVHARAAPWKGTLSGPDCGSMSSWNGWPETPIAPPPVFVVAPPLLIAVAPALMLAPRSFTIARWPYCRIRPA